MRRCIAAQRAGRFAQYASYTTCTPPRVSGPLLLVVASQVVCLKYAVLATSSYTPQHLSPDCGSEGRGFEPRRSPSNIPHRLLVVVIILCVPHFSCLLLIGSSRCCFAV